MKIVYCGPFNDLKDFGHQYRTTPGILIQEKFLGTTVVDPSQR